MTTGILHLAAASATSGWLSLPRQFGMTTLIACGVILVVALAGFIILLARRKSWLRMMDSDALFIERLNGSPHVLAVYQDEQKFENSPRWAVYLAGCRELAYYLIGSDKLDRNFAMRLRAAGRITPSQMAAVSRAMQHRAGESALDMESMHPPVFSCGALLPWIGLLGSVAVFCDSAMNPEVTGWDFTRLVFPALLPLVFSIILALGLIIASRSQARTLREEVARLELFPLELGGSMERAFVDHRQQLDELPSLASLGSPETPSFSLPPSDSGPKNTRA